MSEYVVVFVEDGRAISSTRLTREPLERVLRNIVGAENAEQTCTSLLYALVVTGDYALKRPSGDKVTAHLLPVLN